MFSNLIIKESRISGKGVFADRGFRKFEHICFLTGRLETLPEMLISTEDEQEGSDPLGVDDELYIKLDELPRNFNHSCNPNAFIRGRNELVALKDIKKGEEITWDYSTSMNDNKEKINADGSELWTCECNCTSTSCRGIIDQFKTLPKETQMFYLKNKFAPDFILRAFG
jgi:hypothetical protein